MADAYGIPMPDLPEGAVALECVCLVRCIDSEGNVSLAERMSTGLTRWEAIGMSVTFCDGLRSDLMDDDE